MNTHDIELPPLPEPGEAMSKWAYDEQDMQSYARAAIEADRKRRGEPVKLCDCEKGHNGLGMVGRECDCEAPQAAEPEKVPPVEIKALAEEHLSVEDVPGYGPTVSGEVEFARALLARYGRQPANPTEVK